MQVLVEREAPSAAVTPERFLAGVDAAVRLEIADLVGAVETQLTGVLLEGRGEALR